ncbi:MAG: Elongation factor G-like protein TM_1651 [uncultured Thermomicrobiales bacterium]|uniref:Elongation factor G n=1 Tax=uncultured Thermomicrobiales bacterium TaxID=1645740 RepID=A0A6J4UKT3_9BACT|nr:MAG: Elongation factor G-like protein TM_1651 [uncultured Thermomicrobiales bacterium]
MKQYPADRIRNVGLFSHGGAGKTSLAEACLFVSGGASRLGNIADGSTASDFDPDEIKRGISISTSVIPIEWEDHKINLLDVPGYADFLGEVHAAMRVVDGAVIVIDASAGVQVGTELAWKLANQHKLPRLIFLNKMNRENADFHRTVASVQEAFGKSVAPIQFPIGSDKDFKGVVDLLSNTAMIFSDTSDGGYEIVPIPESLAEECESARRTLVESIAEHNENLMVRYLDDDPLTDEELFGELARCIEDGSVTPMLCGATQYTRCIQPLLSAIVRELPAAASRTEPAQSAGSAITLTADPNAPLAALAFKTVADPHVGRVTLFRVFSGTLSSHSHVRNGSKGEGERIGQAFQPFGKEHPATDHVVAGDFGGVSKLASVMTGDTICADGADIVIAPIAFPPSTYATAVHPKTKSDLDKLSQALVRLHEEDPTLIVARDPGTGETILRGLGAPHVEIALERMTRRSGVNVETALPRVAYRETIGSKTKSEYKHKKQTGGAGQYGHVHLELEPLPESDFEFVEQVVGGSVPRSFFPAVEKGIREALECGPMAGFPVVNVKAILTDGSYHDVDSNEMAFKIAAREAFKKAVLGGSPTLLEPILLLRVTVPELSMGDVMGDLNVKRAHVNGIEPGEDGLSTIEAHIPAAEAQRYATDLRSLTQGRGSFSTEFAYYQPVPSHMAERIRQAVDMKAHA